MIIDEQTGQLFVVENFYSTSEVVRQVSRNSERKIGEIGAAGVVLNENFTKRFG